jgi:hypothetical protein
MYKEVLVKLAELAVRPVPARVETVMHRPAVARTVRGHNRVTYNRTVQK